MSSVGLVSGSWVSILGLAWLAVALAVVRVPKAAAAERELRVTVYNSNIGLVNDRRSVQVPKGQGTVEITDVPALIDPTSVHLRPEQGDLQVLEQNFQYDLAGPDRILQRYLDQTVEAILKGGEVKRGTLLSFDASTLVLRGDGGAVSLVGREEVVDVRLPDLPEGLRTRPTLLWLLQSAEASTQPLELSYLTGGLNWHAEYVAVVDQADTQMDFSAWVSLENNSGASYPEAQLQLVAGEVQRIEPPVLYRRGGPQMQGAMAMDGSKGFEEESFFEYHLYTLDRRTTVADRETKQISLFPSTSAPVTKIFEYSGQQDPRKVRVVLETENREALGLGMPLPAGKVRTYKKDARGQLQFIGEDTIDHTPKNEKVRLRIGAAFDVVGERTELNRQRVSDRVEEFQVEIKLRNRKEEKIEVVVKENLHGTWEITKSSVPFIKKDARTVEFRLEVGADQEVVLTYTARTRW